MPGEYLDWAMSALLAPWFLLVACLHFDSENGGDMFLRNIGECLPDYTGSHPRRQTVLVLQINSADSRPTQLLSLLDLQVGGGSERVGGGGVASDRSVSTNTRQSQQQFVSSSSKGMDPTPLKESRSPSYRPIAEFGSNSAQISCKLNYSV
jgi:hypothetical protein